MLASGGQIAAERAEGCGAGHAAQASGDLLSDLDRADVLLRGVIREWHPEVHREPQDVPTQRTEPVEQVHRDRPLAAPAALRFEVGGAPSGDQRVVAGVPAGQHLGVEGGCPGELGLEDGDVEPFQCGGELGRPRLAGVLPHADEFPDDVRVADRVGHRVAEVRRPAVVHRGPGERGQHPGSVHRLPAAPLVAGVEGQPIGGRRVYPGQPAVDPQPGLVEVRHRGIGEQSTTRSVNGASRSPAAATQTLIEPGETGAASRSLITAAARSSGRWCAATRYVATARTPGPYCTGAWTPPGTPSPGPAIVTRPQAHARCSRRCSTQRSASSGTSATCRFSVDTTGASRTLRPQPPHRSGTYVITSCGSSTWRSVAPGDPGWPPGLRPDRPAATAAAASHRPPLTEAGASYASSPT